jgi:hypothetical protein
MFLCHFSSSLFGGKFGTKRAPRKVVGRYPQVNSVDPE